MESITLKRLLAGPISGHHAPVIYCLFKKIEYLDTTGGRQIDSAIQDSEEAVRFLPIAKCLQLS